MVLAFCQCVLLSALGAIYGRRTLYVISSDTIGRVTGARFSFHLQWYKMATQFFKKKNFVPHFFFSEQICSQLILEGACGAQKELVLTENAKFFGEGSLGVFVEKGR